MADKANNKRLNAAQITRELKFDGKGDMANGIVAREREAVQNAEIAVRANTEVLRITSQQAATLLDDKGTNKVTLLVQSVIQVQNQPEIRIASQVTVQVQDQPEIRIVR